MRVCVCGSETDVLSLEIYWRRQNPPRTFTKGEKAIKKWHKRRGAELAGTG